MTKVVTVGGLAVNDGVNYLARLRAPYSLPAKTPALVRREGLAPKVAKITQEGRELVLEVNIRDAEAKAALRKALYQALDTSQALKSLVISDDDGSNERYVMFACTALDEVSKGTGLDFLALLVVDEESHFLGVTPTTVQWSPSGSGANQNVTNGGDVETYPTYTITPTQAKASGIRWDYRRFVIVRWRSPRPASLHPTLITGNAGWDTASLVSGGKVNGRSKIGVYVDGVQVDRWYGADDGEAGGYNDSGTKIWVNMDFEAAQTVFFRDTLSSGATITELVVDGDISGFPDSGMLLGRDAVEYEIFTYRGKDEVGGRFLNVVRAAKGTTAQTHGSGDALEWLQHNVEIVYGLNRSAQAANDDYKPVMNLQSSTNLTWVFDSFGVTGGVNAGGQWTGLVSGSGEVYETEQDGVRTELGVTTSPTQAGRALWILPVAAGVRAFEVAGNQYTVDTRLRDHTEIAGSRDGSSWTVLAEIDAPLEVDTQEAWEVDESWDDGTVYWYLALRQVGTTLINGAERRVHMNAATITFDSVNEYTIDAVVGEEIANYDLALMLENTTTGESLVIETQMAVDKSLEIDTGAHTVRYLEDGANLYGDVAWSSLRREMLRLVPGVNTLKVTETGLAGMDVVVEFVERFFA